MSSASRASRGRTRSRRRTEPRDGRRRDAPAPAASVAEQEAAGLLTPFLVDLEAEDLLLMLEHILMEVPVPLDKVTLGVEDTRQVHHITQMVAEVEQVQAHLI